MEHWLVLHRPTNRIPTTTTDRNLLRRTTQKGKKLMAVQSPGQIRQAAIVAERKRLNLILESHIQELWDRVNTTQSDDMKSSWTIAILELKQVQDIANNPVNGIRTR